MANLILPRSAVVTNEIMNFFMTAPVGGIALPAATAIDIGPTIESWFDDTGSSISEFPVNPSVSPSGHQYAYQLYVDGQIQELGLITTVNTISLFLTSTTAATIPPNARIVFTVVDIGTA